MAAASAARTDRGRPNGGEHDPLVGEAMSRSGLAGALLHDVELSIEPARKDARFAVDPPAGMVRQSTAEVAAGGRGARTVTAVPTLYVITAVLGPDPELLAQAEASLGALDLPLGWGLEWLIQEDGDDPAGCGPSWADYEANGYQLGPGATRNLALGRARGELVAVLDADDRFTPALGELVATLAARPGLGWAAGMCDDLVEGRLVSFPPLIPAGDVAAGVVVDTWTAGGVFPLVCAGAVVFRADVLRRVGAWGALPVHEDSFAVVAVSENSPGYVSHTVVHHYRRHAAQTTASPRFAYFRPKTLRYLHRYVAAVRAERPPAALTDPRTETQPAA
jgi:hypothetical protein